MYRQVFHLIFDRFETSWKVLYHFIQFWTTLNYFVAKHFQFVIHFENLKNFDQFQHKHIVINAINLV